MNRSLWLRIYGVLWVGIVLGLVTILPYQIAVSGDVLQQAVTESGIPLTMLLTISIVSGAIQLGGLLALGLFIGERVGMGVPRLKRWFLKTAPLFDSWQEIITLVVGGITLGLVLIAMDTLIFARYTADLLQGFIPPPLWQRALTPFYGGIVEEIMMRLVGVSVVAWGLGLFWRRNGKVADGAVWVAIFTLSILFGIGHLPALLLITETLTPALIVRTLVLNGLGGVIFGYIYWKRGLVPAMLMHASTDIGLHVIGLTLVAWWA